PVDAAKSTPLTTSGGSGDAISRDVQPAWNAGFAPSSTSVKVTMPCGEGAANQRVPLASVQVDSAPVSNSGVPNDALVATGPLPRDAGSKTRSLPPPATTSASLSFHVNTTGDELKLTPATFAEALRVSVFGSSANTELDSGSFPAVVAMYTVPSRPMAAPSAPAIVAVSTLNAVTGFCALPRSIAHSASG